MTKPISITRTEKIPFYKEFDIIVGGGGVAGCAAALSAARAGKKVLLLEKTCILGGLATTGLVNFFVPMCNGRGTQIIRGMAEEFLNLAIRYGFDTIPPEWKNGEPEKKTTVRYTSAFSPWIFALALTDLLTENKIEILFDSIIVDALMKDHECTGLVIENKSGRSYCSASVFIDATGDADILARAGVPTVERKNYFTYFSHGVTLQSCKDVVESGNFARLRHGGIVGGTADLHGHRQPPEIPLFSGTDGEDVSRYLIMNQKLMLEGLKKTPKNSRDILSLPAMPQLRTTRRIEGDYTLMETDAYQHFEDSVGAICDFERRDYLYEIPFRTLINSAYPNILTAGRSTSGEGYAWDVMRVIPPAILSGEAAGYAAALSIDSKKGISDIEIPLLQRAMEKGGNIIHFNDDLVPSASSSAEDLYEDNGHI